MAQTSSSSLSSSASVASAAEAPISSTPTATTTHNGSVLFTDALIPRLEDFHISEKTGFLIEQPLTELPAYFAVWNELGQQVAELLTSHALRSAVDKMPLLDHRLLSGHRQWRLAYTILSFVGNGYVWQEGETALVKKIPRQLAIPWHGVSTYFGLKPGVCQTNGMLSNWTVVEPSRPLTIDNMKLICAFPGGINCQWFFLVTAQVEMNIVPGLKAILEAKRSILSGDIDRLRHSLDGIADNIRLLKSIVTRMNENLDANVFYNTLRPFLSGWGGTSTVMPDGLIFEGVSDEPLTVIGGSAAQSSTIQCFDAALGITHEPDRQQFLDTMRTYMPQAHAQFIVALQRAPSIRDFVCGCRNEAVMEAYKRCVVALSEFRSYHLQITTKYIVSKAKAVRGTGGTELMPFLKGIRDTTAAAAVIN